MIDLDELERMRAEEEVARLRARLEEADAVIEAARKTRHECECRFADWPEPGCTRLGTCRSCHFREALAAYSSREALSPGKENNE